MRKYKLGEKTIEVIHADDADNPRDWACVSKIVCFHWRYKFPNDADIRSQDFDGWDSIEKHLRKKLGAKVVTPIFLHDHSGLAISHEPFSCPWDSWQIGFAYVDREGAEVLKTNRKKRLEEAMLSELRDWGAYVSGNCWAYKDDEEVWHGTYYGDVETSGLLEDAFGTKEGVEEL